MMGSWGGMMGDWGTAGWIGMGLGMLVWTAVAVLTVWLIVRGLMALERRNDRPAGADDAESLLRRRFAAGEIDREEYEQRLAALRG